MQTHLIEFKSDDSLRSQVGLNKLTFCMMVLNDIKQTYSSATFIHSIFLEAIEQLHARHGTTVASSSIDDNLAAQEEQMRPAVLLPIEDYSFLYDPFWETSMPFPMEATQL
jgi:hypothetical protein